ncbi:Cytochrome c oxidase assembly protein cox20, mitochondrial [Irineochytrium annulatum]|nr:Cytochrome c oxidase assembly protein cox20, mitochondrial [Irineochytrium annulatum]
MPSSEPTGGVAQPPGAHRLPIPEDGGPPSVVDVAKTIKLEDFKLDNVGKVPCNINSTLYGLSAGGLVAGSRYFFRRNAMSAGSWGMVTFGVVAMASWELCRFQRKVVREQMSALAASRHGQPRGAPELPLVNPGETALDGRRLG